VPKATGKVAQKAQFADATIVNLVDPLSATLALTADGTPITVQIFYSGDKTTTPGEPLPRRSWSTPSPSTRIRRGGTTST